MDKLEELERRIDLLESMVGAVYRPQYYCDHDWRYINDTAGNRKVCFKCGQSIRTYSWLHTECDVAIGRGGD